MALGNNLKKKKLIPEEGDKETQKKSGAAKKASVKKATSKKKVAPKKKAPKVVKKKELIKPEKKVLPQEEIVKEEVVQAEENVVEQQAPSPSPVKPAEQKPTEFNSGLPIYIAQELYEKKSKLRERYKNEVANLKGEVAQFVVFEVGGEQYAVDIDSVKEIVPLPTLSKTPNTPAHIKGIANVRGETYTVFDLGTKFKIESEEQAKYLLTVESEEVVASLTLSTLPSTFKVKGEQISSSFQMIEDASLDVSYIKGIIQHEEQLIYYLDIIELLKNDKAIVVPDQFSKTE